MYTIFTMKPVAMKKLNLAQKTQRRKTRIFLLVILLFSFNCIIYAENQITIASFNLRVFGIAKAENPAVIDEIASIIRNFDIVAVQEIRDKSETAANELLTAINNGSNIRYEVLLGPRIGRTSSKEQYAFYYRTSTIIPIGITETWKDTNDQFEREPFLAMFKVKEGTFDFVLANIHTKPDDAANEILLLPKVMKDSAKDYSEPDVLCLGDWNADGSYFNEDTYSIYFPSKDYLWIISNSADTSIASKSNTYDRMAASISMEEDWTGIWNILRFDQNPSFKSKGMKTLDISDHYPVWTSFYVDRDTD
jgi:deoxyribonuclease-1-like protein